MRLMGPARQFFAVEPDAAVRPLLSRLWPAVQQEMDRHRGLDVSVHCELRAVPSKTGGAELVRFYWSTQRAEPESPLGFSARTLYCEGATTDLRLFEFPAEPVLTWLDAHDGPLRARGHTERVDILRYIPCRRLTFRLSHGVGLPGSVIGKAKGTSGLTRATTAFMAVHHAASKRRTAAPRVPRVLRLEPPRHVLYLEDMPGEPLSTAVRWLDRDAAMERLATMHRAMHELPVRGLGARRATDEWLRRARHAINQIGLFVPSATDLAERVYAELARTTPADLWPRFCQGDFLPAQILCHEGGWIVLDFDDSHYADPLSEVAAMYAAMPRELHLPPHEADRARRTYVDAYAVLAGADFDPDRWRWYLVLVQLLELGKRLAKGRVGPEETDAILSRLAAPVGEAEVGG